MIIVFNFLLRVFKNGCCEIGNMFCWREFDLGNLFCVYVKFVVEYVVFNLFVGVDLVGGIWFVMVFDIWFWFFVLVEK